MPQKTNVLGTYSPQKVQSVVFHNNTEKLLIQFSQDSIVWLGGVVEVTQRSTVQ